VTDGAAYGLPTPPLVTFTEAEQIGAELHDRWALLSGGEPPLTREDYAWSDIAQFVIRRADEIARARKA
jgi:hypothetical protein